MSVDPWLPKPKKIQTSQPTTTTTGEDTMTTAATETTSYVNENRRPIHSAVLFSSFPEDIRQKTKDELLTRFGVDIQDVMPLERLRGLKGAMERHNLIFIHHEMGSAKDTARIKKIAKSLGKEVIPISRKNAAWEEQLRYKLTPAAPVSKRVIPDERMEGFLREYVDLKSKGFTLSQMLDPLNKYRSTGKFEQTQQLAVIIAKLGARKPAWFQEWESSFVEQPKPAPVEGATATGEVIPQPTNATSIPEIKEEDERELATMYANENADLREKIAELEDKNKHLAASGKAWASKILEHVKALVDEGAISKEQGFEMMAAAAGKKGA
jgi:FtsZ-binding cell division protein ZapB